MAEVLVIDDLQPLDPRDPPRPGVKRRVETEKIILEPLDVRETERMTPKPPTPKPPMPAPAAGSV